MRERVVLLLVAGVVALLTAPPGSRAIITDETEGNEFMKELDLRFNYECNRDMVARWDYITDVADPDKEEVANDAAVRYLSFKGEAAVNATEYAYDGFTDTELYRRFRFISKQGPGALDQASLTEYKRLQAKMETTYSTAIICDYHNPTKCDLTLEPDIEMIMASSENWDELRYVWQEWREKTGKVMRDDFVQFVNLSNRAAELDGFADTGEYWLNGYTVDQREADYFTGEDALDQAQFRDMLETVWTQVSEGLYKKLHAYVRMRLQEVYPGKIDPTGPIPSHILGNMWAQDWTSIARFVTPFPEFPTFDVTDSMVENGWDIQQMFDAAEDFFTSVGLFNMTQTFWDKSVIKQTAWGKTIVCHASAEDFCVGSEGEDYRIKMCTEVNMADLVTVHHEMGHIEYFMAYKNLPHVFRDSANPGFHEAIGDLIALSVSTPQHMENILGLTPTRRDIKGSKYTDQEMRDLNFLMRMALEKIAFLPFGYLIDKYRWSVYDGSIPSSELNAGWWALRESLQGVSPPEGTRGEEFFDPGAKYHVPANVPYIRYFVSFIVQFQFHARLCEAAGHTGPLYDCDIYNNKDAGGILRTALEKGFSEPWPKVLSELGGSADMDPQPIIDYFAPLIAYLDEVLVTAEECVGWGSDCDGGRSAEEEADSRQLDDDMITDDFTTADFTTADFTTNVPTTETPEEQAAEDMARMNANLTAMVQWATKLDWEYNTNTTEENEQVAKDAWIVVSQTFAQFHAEVIQKYKDEYENFEDESLKRQFCLQKNLGTAVLEDEDLEKLNTAVMYMTNNYTNLVCAYKTDCTEDKDEEIAIDDLEKLMGESEDYDELLYYWEAWREASGKVIVDDYETYVDLQNEAAFKNEFEDAGKMWVQEGYADVNYTGVDFIAEIEDLWAEVKPLYLKLHAYVRHHLRVKYELDNDDLIPAHLLGNMWAQSWENIYDLVAPFPNTDLIDITEDLDQYIEDERDMFRISEDFFTSLGLYKMGQDFTKNSLFVQPENTTVICHASAWDFYDEVDDPLDGRFRIKMCADKNQEDFIVIHHEMGHTEYQMSYSVPTEEQPLVFRDGANPGFHEAIGDTIALSVSTPKHLQKISEYLQSRALGAEDPEEGNLLVPRTTADEPSYNNDTINFLMKTALAKVAFLPYAYIMDKWRWELFQDPKLDYNREWWNLRVTEQGLYPPVDRYPNWDFDPGSKYHVAAGVPYVRYFVSFILQFQFHERLCGLAGMTADDDIYYCDIYGSEAAGDELKKLLEKGASEGWHQQLQEFLVDTDRMNATALLTYFQPLSEYLDNFLEENDIKPGWKATNADDFMKTEPEEIPPIVPIVVGCILAVMVLVVLVAYFVGRGRQKKAAKKKAASENVAPKSAPPSEQVELEEGIASGSGDAGSTGKGSGDD